MASKSIVILGTRGIPAQHGGFETFAERLSCYLVDNGWEVTVYCQSESRHSAQPSLHGVKLAHIPTRFRGTFGTILFDLRAVWRSRRHPGIALTLGYNTAVFNFLHKLRRIPSFINMDGIEWQRAKWGALAKFWLLLNERLAFCACDHLIADHPEIAMHLASRRDGAPISMIPYGADRVVDAPASYPMQLGLKPQEYFLIVARAEPENSLLELVTAFSSERRGKKLAVLGHVVPSGNRYHRTVTAAASDEVVFLGPIYDPAAVAALRYHAFAYLHGHQNGGTNPSLVEALGAGNAVIAHDNHFNRWVAADAALYFDSVDDASAKIGMLISSNQQLAAMRVAAVARHARDFTWDKVLGEYQKLFLECLDSQR